MYTACVWSCRAHHYAAVLQRPYNLNALLVKRPILHRCHLVGLYPPHPKPIQALQTRSFSITAQASQMFLRHE